MLTCVVNLNGMCVREHKFGEKRGQPASIHNIRAPSASSADFVYASLRCDRIATFGLVARESSVGFVSDLRESISLPFPRTSAFSLWSELPDRRRICLARRSRAVVGVRH
jgi:hypothetical protein